MKLFTRVCRFSLVGIISTVTHYGLLLFLALYLPIWLANSVAFSISFMVSFVLQQRYTFFDRLGDNKLNLNAAIIVFIANIACAAIVGLFVSGKHLLLLPLLPALVNFSLFYYLPELKSFVRTK